MSNPSSHTIHILAIGNNQRGDLFNRLIGDLFFALGYSDLRFNVHKSGREIDLQGTHRLESRGLVAECKATDAKIGGTALNTFFGVLERERTRNSSRPLVGYFVSLSGFTETAIEQERLSGPAGLILLDSAGIVSELEKCRVVVSRLVAAERAGQCVQRAGLPDAAPDGFDLIGHEIGYVWAAYYSHGKTRTHVAFIHADGTPLAESIANELFKLDAKLDGALKGLSYLAPPPPPTHRSALTARAVERYRQWLGEECGYIYLDGLPADADLSTTRLRLERLFVPVKAVRTSGRPKRRSQRPESESNKNTVLIGTLLAKTPQLAILAMPGGGKSTLLKRLATAYAFPDRRGEVRDELPDRDWLPLLLRCRELRDRAHRPITELIDDVAGNVGLSEEESEAFQKSTREALRLGKALLLIDGLDEIADEGTRRIFADHLRTFQAMFPQVALVVTSREAGFRLVAGIVASMCKQVRLAPLDPSDIVTLCEKWHVEVLGASEKVRRDARALGELISTNSRISSLANNPLLLTTLLVVKRTLQELPRSRTALYREAIRVLVRTWNVEGYAPLDEDETLAQLSYVACAMTEEGKQQITHDTLLSLLRRARQELEAELQFARVSPESFVERIEYRSSLLVQTGHAEAADGRGVQPLYEFRHLTFQEYLAARGYVEEQYPGRNTGRSLADLLEPHFSDEGWSEVIALSAVLAGRKAEDLVSRLIGHDQHQPTRTARPIERTRGASQQILLQCIRDEVQLTASSLRLALRSLARDPINIGRRRVFDILQGKFGSVFRSEIAQTYMADDCDGVEYLLTLANIANCTFFDADVTRFTDDTTERLLVDLGSDNVINRINAALVCMQLAYERAQFGQRPKSFDETIRERFQPLVPKLSEMLQADLSQAIVASWAFVWLGSMRLVRISPDVVLSLFRLWRQLHDVCRPKARYPAWALSLLPLFPRDTFAAEAWGDCDVFLRQAAMSDPAWNRSAVYPELVVGWYRRAPWTDEELFEQLARCAGEFSFEQTARDLLSTLGSRGRRIVSDWERRHVVMGGGAKIEALEGESPDTVERDDADELTEDT